MAGSVAQGGLLSSVTSSNNAVAKVNGVSNITHTVGSINTGTVAVDLEVFKLHTPITLNFAYLAGGADTLTDYAVTLNVKNSSPTQAAGNLNFKGFDVTRNITATGAVASSGIRQTVAPTSNVFAVQYAGVFNITNGFRWGGLNGGGPVLGPGLTAINTFVYRVTWDGTNSAGTSALSFVANPEPTTLLLGSLVMFPAAVVARRRRKAAAELIEA